MVVSEEPLATDVGVRVLKAGGNAVDAAVAVGFALAVTHPAAGNLGGGGFMLVRLADGRSPSSISASARPPTPPATCISGPTASPPASIEGWRAAGVPGTVRGLEFAHRKWGPVPGRSSLPRYGLARNGFVLSYGEAKSLTDANRLRRFPDSKRIFLNDGFPSTLATPRAARPRPHPRPHRPRRVRDFYEGETARILAEQMALHGGLITLDDLKNYTVVERKPLHGSYRGYEIMTSPPPSSGGIGILQMLGMLERYRL